MTGKHNVYVFRDDDDGKYKVRPALAFGLKGKPFSIRNLTNQALQPKFPAGLMKEAKPERVPPRKPKTYHVTDGADGLFSYTVYVLPTADKKKKKKKKKKAEGESDPRIIID